MSFGSLGDCENVFLAQDRTKLSACRKEVLVCECVCVCIGQLALPCLQCAFEDFTLAKICLVVFLFLTEENSKKIRKQKIHRKSVMLFPNFLFSNSFPILFLFSNSFSNFPSLLKELSG